MVMYHLNTRWSRRLLHVVVLTVGLDLQGAGVATAHPVFCADHEEYRTGPHTSGRIYKAACAIPRRLCKGSLVQAARPHETLLVPHTVAGTAWMLPCDFEQGRGTSDLAEALHRWGAASRH